ncbi:Smr/MutS family protein [Frigidibacter sp. ROC022]|uniref:Smr/MutS family protein n=1 Tax=Frigidibacter sp. ROC022 TaxID=2971796 RepID=UPI00215B0CD9|nr:Smr/MutS family protein [Frigidibacter sp. ROC022]MCR8724482.1 Smr/MutS family protein [Frigidibacter sp. ROC022]
MRRRKLRKDESELWAKVIEAAKPLHPDTAAFHRPAPAKPQIPERQPPLPDDFGLPPLSRHQRPSTAGVSLDLRPTVSERLASQRIEMDRKKFGKMKRGKLAPDARIDLHGMTQAQAHSALTGFLMRSYSTGHRLVLVITGKGPGPAMGGVLRHQVPHWLSLPPMRELVLQLSEAHRSHGGSGAIYVYLRRKREG